MANETEVVEPSLDDFEPTALAYTPEGDEGEKTPSRNDPEWTDYVLGLLADDEKRDGYPKCTGLRRLAEKLLGDIVYSVPRTVQVPNPSNAYTSTVEYEVRIKFNDDERDVRIFADVADVTEENTARPFSLHPSATAASKAEGRALRKALKLKTLTAEEMSDIPDPDKITPGMILYINSLCKRLNINIIKFIESGKTTKGKRIDEIPYATAVQMRNRLNEFQNGKLEVPANISGYDENWRD